MAGPTNGAARGGATGAAVHSSHGSRLSGAATIVVTISNPPSVVPTGAPTFTMSVCSGCDLVTGVSATTMVTIDSGGPPTPSGPVITPSSRLAILKFVRPVGPPPAF